MNLNQKGIEYFEEKKKEATLKRKLYSDRHLESLRMILILDNEINTWQNLINKFDSRKNEE